MNYNSVESAGKVLELLESSQEATTTFKVREQDQDSPTLILKFNKIESQTTLASKATTGQRDIVVSDATGIVTGKYLIIFSPPSNRVGFFYVTGVAGTTITLDSIIDYAYEAGSFVEAGITNMGVNGASTPQVFGLRGQGTPTGISQAVDVNKIRLSCQADSPVDLSKFGDLTALTRGLLIRHRRVDGTYNVLNVKTNLEIGGVFDNWTPYAATNPAQGIDGFLATITFNGQENMSVVKRLETGEDLEIIIQDDLSGLTILDGYAEGHYVQ